MPDDNSPDVPAGDDAETTETTDTTVAASSFKKSSKKSASDRNADVAQLGYEDARDELARIVAQLEAGSVPLEESMRLWERGEALAAHCHKWLDDAQGRVEQLTGDKADH